MPLFLISRPPPVSWSPARSHRPDHVVPSASALREARPRHPIPTSAAPEGGGPHPSLPTIRVAQEGAIGQIDCSGSPCSHPPPLVPIRPRAAPDRLRLFPSAQELLQISMFPRPEGGKHIAMHFNSWMLCSVFLFC